MHRDGRRHPLAVFMLVTLLSACGLGAAPLAERLALDPVTLERTGRPNDFLVCPERQCSATSDRVAPVLEVAPADQLRLWEEVVTASPRTRVLQVQETQLTIHAEQRSRLLRFVDTIAVRIIPLEEGRSTFAAYSRSELGYSDMGVNQARLEDWIARIEAAAGSASNNR
jgi:uncharacterized protein (DUF1499 family)